MERRVAVILNRQAGERNGEAIREKIAALFQASGRTAEISIAPAHSVEQLAEQHARGETDLVVAAGGDGTVSSVAAALVGGAGEGSGLS